MIATAPFPHHDSAAFLEVVFLQGNGADGERPGHWYVRRTCRCHMHQLVTIGYCAEWRAKRARSVMDEVTRRWPNLAKTGH